MAKLEWEKVKHSNRGKDVWTKDVADFYSGKVMYVTTTTKRPAKKLDLWNLKRMLIEVLRQSGQTRPENVLTLLLHKIKDNNYVTSTGKIWTIPKLEYTIKNYLKK
jgi:hypothetical protein